ncbi:MAG: branched-chain amino acid ABC transporter permease [Nitrospinota bacterium]
MSSATRLALGAVLLAALLILPGFVPEYHLGIGIDVLLWAYLAGCWNLLGGYAGLPSLGNALFVGAGAYTSTLFAMKAGLSPWAGMILGGLAATLLGLFIGFLSFRYGIRGPYFALVTLAFAEIIVKTVDNIPPMGGAHGLNLPFGSDPLRFQFSGKLPYYYIVFLMLAGLLFLTRMLSRRRTGYYFLAIRENEAAAQAMGVNLMRYKLTATALSAFLSALGGTFYAQYHEFIHPDSVLGMGVSLEILIYAIVGGVGFVMGPLVGAALLIPLDETIRVLLGAKETQGVHLMIIGAVLVFVVLKMPDGILGWARKRLAAGGARS